MGQIPARPGDGRSMRSDSSSDCRSSQREELAEDNVNKQDGCRIATASVLLVYGYTSRGKSIVSVN